MIAIDTSAIMAIVLNEPEAHACVAALEAEDAVLISTRVRSRPGYAPRPDWSASGASPHTGDLLTQARE